MREIKFRFVFRHKESGEIIFYFWTVEQLLHEKYINHSYYTLISIDLYTGINDKNGKEIYEEDIIRNTFYDERDSFNRCKECKKKKVDGQYIGRANYHRGRFLWMCGKVGIPGLHEFDEDYLENIGNPYENPELLKEASNA